MMLALLRPEFVIPFHGDFRHMVLYRKMALGMGELFKPENVLLPENGTIMEFGKQHSEVVGTAPVGYVYVDGASVGDLSHVVVRDRQMLARDGILMVVVSMDRSSGAIVSGPDIVSRGFVHMRESDELIEATKEVVRKALTQTNSDVHTEMDSSFMNRKVKDVVSEFLYEKTRRRPMVIPVVTEL